MKNQLFIFLLFGWIAQVTFAPLALSITVVHSDCPLYFGKLDLTPYNANVPANAYAERVWRKMKARSDDTLARLQKATREGKPEVVDNLVIGSGPHSAMFTSTLLGNDPGRKVLTLESREFGNWMREAGSTMFLNSPELGDESANLLRGSLVQLRQFNHRQVPYPSITAMGDATLVSHHASGAPLVFQQRVAKVEERIAGSNWPARYRVTTADGTQIFAHQIDDARGVGRPVLPVTDMGTKEFLVSPDARGLVFYQDEFFERAASLARQEKDFLAELKGQKVAIIGNGGGAKVTVESLVGGGPAELYPLGTKAAADLDVTWVGIGDKTLEEYVTHNPGQRVFPGVEKAFTQPNFKTEAGLMVSMRPAVGDELKKGKVAIYLKGRTEPLFYDKVILSTGYEAEVNDIFAPLVNDFGRIERKPVLGTVPDAGGIAPVARQLVTDGKPQDIYVIGQSANFKVGAEIPADEWDNALGVGIDVYGRRTEAFAETLAATRRGTGKLIRLAGATPGERPVFLKVDLAQAVAPDGPGELVLRVKLQGILSRVRFPGAAQFKVLFDPLQGLVYEGVSPQTAFWLHQEIQRSPESIGALRQLAAQSGRPLKIEIPIWPDGRLRLEKAVIQ